MLRTPSAVMVNATHQSTTMSGSAPAKLPNPYHGCPFANPCAMDIATNARNDATVMMAMGAYTSHMVVRRVMMVPLRLGITRR